MYLNKCFPREIENAKKKVANNINNIIQRNDELTLSLNLLYNKLVTNLPP